MSDTRTFSIMAKPVGAACNLCCTYCYYLGRSGSARMSDAVLETYIGQTLEPHGRDATVVFAWHGGEPTLMGLPFFRRAVELQNHLGAGRRVSNTLQTNGVLLDEDWCRFFREHDFMVSLSIDGPEPLHDAYRLHGDGKGSFRGRPCGG